MTKQKTKALTSIEVNLVVHENAHAFENALERISGYKLPRNTLEAVQRNNPGFPNRVEGGTGNFGFAGPAYGWQQSIDSSPGEEFADMFIGWVYSTWGIDNFGTARMDFMVLYMPGWINLALTK